ncbi:hypothetical protein CR513_21904, partial [Mucuna pruriens]
MTTRKKIDVHAETLSMEFGDTLVQFNIFEAMKHPTEDHSLFSIDLIDELVEECLQLDNRSEDISIFAKDIDAFDCLKSITKEVDYDELWEVHNLFDSKDDNIDLANLSQEAELLLDQEAKIMSAHQVFSSIQVGQPDLKVTNDNSSSPPPPIELKPLPSHLKYAYLDEDKLLRVRRQHKKAIRWKLSNIPGINPSICMHKILMAEEARPIR